MDSWNKRQASLVTAWQLTGDQALLVEAFEAHRQELDAKARLIARRFNYIPKDDIVSECYLGFMDAARDFDTSRSDDFAGYVIHKCWSRVLHYSRDKARLIRLPALQQDYDLRCITESMMTPGVMLYEESRDKRVGGKPSMQTADAMDAWYNQPKSVVDSREWQLILNALRVYFAGGSARAVTHALGYRVGNQRSRTIYNQIRSYLNETNPVENLHDALCWPIRPTDDGSDVVSGIHP